MMTQVTTLKNIWTSGYSTLHPMMTQHLRVILAFFILFALIIFAYPQTSKANPIISGSTPGMLMANIVFDIGNTEEGDLITPQKLRLEIMNSSGAELVYIQSSIKTEAMEAGFSYGKKDNYKRPNDYPRSRENFIVGSPTNYTAALARYNRAVYLYKSSQSATEKKRAQDYMEYCYKKAMSFYKIEYENQKRLDNSPQTHR